MRSMNELARKGAELRIAELKSEERELRKMFPGLGERQDTASDTPAPKARRTMSAKARKAIGDAQRARWAKLRKEK